MHNGCSLNIIIERLRTVLLYKTSTLSPEPVIYHSSFLQKLQVYNFPNILIIRCNISSKF